MGKLCPMPVTHLPPKDYPLTLNPWALDDLTPRQRYTKTEVKRGETERIQCRADAFNVRRIDEIVASRIEPTLKTRSDVLNDALSLWLDDWDSKYPDGVGGELAYQARLKTMERKRIYRNDFLEDAKAQIENLQSDGDLEGLTTYLHLMQLAQGDFQSSAPESYVRQLKSLIDQARRLIEAAN
jgi:hypothetical protein